uniref:PAS domain-containing protein n=1 Tax=Heterorhabditis bacteriophora TaxID=37862 RepID=A0A1I7WLM5_HETBA
MLENHEFTQLARELPLARAISGQHIDKLMDSFLMVLDFRGDVLYVSETISIYLGLSQVEMTGNPVSEYIHPEDWHQFQTPLSDFINSFDLFTRCFGLVNKTEILMW